MYASMISQQLLGLITSHPLTAAGAAVAAALLSWVMTQTRGAA